MLVGAREVVQGRGRELGFQGSTEVFQECSKGACRGAVTVPVSAQAHGGGRRKQAESWVPG